MQIYTPTGETKLVQQRDPLALVRTFTFGVSTLPESMYHTLLSIPTQDTAICK